MAPADPVDVASLAERVRDMDLTDSDRFEAALVIVTAASLRSLTDLIAVVYGPDPRPSPAGFEACAAAWDASRVTA